MEIQQIMDRIEQVCRRHRVRELYLFGSWATGFATPASDIDIIVKGVPDLDSLQDDLDDIETLKKIDVFDYDHCRNEDLKEAMDRYGRKIYGALP